MQCTAFKKIALFYFPDEIVIVSFAGVINIPEQGTLMLLTDFFVFYPKLFPIHQHTIEGYI